MADEDIKLVFDLPEGWKPPPAFYRTLLKVLVDMHQREFPEQWDDRGGYVGPAAT